MNFTIELKGVEEALKIVDPQLVIQSMKRAISRATNAGRTIISSQIREKFNIKKSDLDPKIGVDLSNLNQGIGILSVRGDPISMTYFGPSQIRGNIKTFVSKNKGLAQKQVKRAGTGGVAVKIISGKTAQLRGAFIATGKGGNIQVFRRKGKERLPIMALKVISYASIIKKPANLTAIESRILEQLDKEFASALDYYKGQ
jgi:hypothetical protein